MRKLIKIILLLFITQSLFAQNDWFWQNPKPMGNNYTCSYFENANNGLAFGPSGLVMKTTNAGVNWNVIYNDFSYDINGIYFFNINTGWAVGSKGSINKTTNGGVNWQSVNTGTLNDLKCIFFTDDLKGYAVGNNSTFLKTTNGGSVWALTQIDTLNSGLISVHFYDSLKGCAFGDVHQYKTIDGGNTWFHTQINPFIKTTFYKDSTCWQIRNDWKTYRAINFDLNWSVYPAGFIQEPKYVYFINLKKGFVSDRDGRIYITIDSGKTWTTVYSGMELTSVSFPDSTNGFAFGGSGTILKTTNGGNNWTAYSSSITNLNIKSINFLNANTGFALATSFYTTYFVHTNKYLKTTNQGMSWYEFSTSLNNFGSLSSFSMDFVNNTHGMCVGYAYIYTGGGSFVYQSKVFTTVDGGQNWAFASAGISGQRATILKLVDTLYAWAGSSGSVVKTTDFGNTWTGITPGGASSFNDIFLFGKDDGYVLAANKLCYTSNGGTQWSSQTLDGTYNSVYFSSRQTGWVCGSNILKTTNGGVNWIVNSNISGLNKIKFLDDQTGYAVGIGGVIYKTTNSGIEWTQNSHVNCTLNDIDLIDSKHVWAGGDFGTIISSVDGTVNITQNSNIIPEKFSLSQNYPNPFNPSTKINYEVKSSGFVSLKVFDLLGKEVASLVNEKQNAGSYAVDFNSSEFNLSSGIYFYTLNAGEFKETRKMVLVK